MFLPHFPFCFFQTEATEMFSCWLVSDYHSKMPGYALYIQFPAPQDPEIK